MTPASPRAFPTTLDDAQAEIIRLEAALQLERLRFERYTATTVIVLKLFGVPTDRLLSGEDRERAMAALHARITKFAEWDAHEQTATIFQVTGRDS